MALPTKVVVITGATSGIGLSLLSRLILETRLQFILHICILCRNLSKGEFVRSSMALMNSSVQIDLIKMDTGEVPSVLQAVEEIKKRYKHIDYLYLNAGILPVKRLNIWALFSRDIYYRLKTGDVILEADNPINHLGIPLVFATNILGHFLLVQELLPLLKAENTSPSKIIWTTSNNAVKRSFDIDDFMCEHGTLPYGSSKYVMNGVSIALNHHFNSEGVYSCLAEPGLCITQISERIMPGWLWRFVDYLFQLLRFFARHFTLSTYNGAEALLWLFKQDPKSLEKNYQYESSVNIYNQTYVANEKLNMSFSEAEAIYQKMLKVAEGIREQVADH